MDYSGYADLAVDTTDIDTYTMQLCHFEPDKMPDGSSIPSPSTADLLKFGGVYLLNNIKGISFVAINSVVGAGETVANTFEDGFDIVVSGLSNFGGDISGAFTQAGSEIMGGINFTGGAFATFGG